MKEASADVNHILRPTSQFRRSRTVIHVTNTSRGGEYWMLTFTTTVLLWPSYLMNKKIPISWAGFSCNLVRIVIFR